MTDYGLFLFFLFFKIFQFDFSCYTATLWPQVSANTSTVNTFFFSMLIASANHEKRSQINMKQHYLTIATFHETAKKGKLEAKHSTHKSSSAEALCLVNIFPQIASFFNEINGLWRFYRSYKGSFNYSTSLSFLFSLERNNSSKIYGFHLKRKKVF